MFELKARTITLLLGALVVVVITVAIFHIRTSAGERLPVIELAPDFELTNQDLKKVRFSELEGKVTVMTFIYAKCAMPRRCPLTTKNFKRTQDLLGKEHGKDVVFLSITFDPESDTPEALKGYGKIYGADFGNWHFLTGTPDEIDKVCADYQIIKERQESGSIRHSLITFLIDQKRNVRKMYFANQWSPKDLKRDIATLLD